jgi:uncharacterized protein (TIGR00730 family)
LRKAHRYSDGRDACEVMISRAQLYSEIMSEQFRGKSVAVFCASASGARPEYMAAANALGRTLAECGIGLIYGGGNTGLMGAVADGALAAGGHVVGVIPEVLVDLEVAHRGVTELHVTSTMHTRKALMAARADAFIILPGGYGTFEEMFEVLAWQTLKIHSKPVVLLNVAGFFDTLLAFLDVCDGEGMLRGNRGILLVAESSYEAIRLAGLEGHVG